jgi:hypothetical protein
MTTGTNNSFGRQKFLTAKHMFRVGIGGTTYIPAGKNATDAEAKRLRMLGKVNGREVAEKGWPRSATQRLRFLNGIPLLEEFEDYIADAQKRNALEAGGTDRAGGQRVYGCVKVEYNE